MILGTYTFAWLPDKMTIPRPGKTVAVQNALGGTAYLSWPVAGMPASVPAALPTIGEVIEMEWGLMPVAQYESLRAIYLVGATVGLSLPTDGLRVPTGSAASVYNVRIMSMAGKFLEVADYQIRYRKDVKVSMLIRGA